MAIKVSIITPFHNGLSYLGDCITSILAQTLKEVELILIDDGSTDGSGELADIFMGLDNRVKAIHQKNAGVSAARNAGLNAAQGEYIGFVDADDFIDTDMYEKMYAAAIEGEADIINAGYMVNDSLLNKNETVKPSLETGKALSHTDIRQYAIKMHSAGSFLYTWRNLFARRLIEETKIRFDEDIAVGEDTLFNMACFLKAERVISLDLCPYHYRIHPDGCMRQKHKPRLNASLQKQYDEKLRLCNQFFPEQREAFCCDMFQYTVTALLPTMLSNIYLNDIPDKKLALKATLQSDMIRQSLSGFDLNSIRSKSLDWLMFWFAKKRMYGMANGICKHYLYKK